MELQKKIEELGTAFEEFKKLNDQRLEDIKKNGSAAGDLEEKVAKANEHIGTLEKQIEQLNAAIARKANGGKDLEPELTAEQKASKEQKEALTAYLRKGIESKALSTDSDEDGGFLVNPEMSSEIVKKIFESTPMRELASVQVIGSDSLEILEDLDEVGSGWVGEIAARTETTSPTLKKVMIPVHELYAKPKATQRFLDDASVNVEQWLGAKVAEKFARDEATAFVSGNGVNKPKGILAYADGSTFGTVQRQRTANATALDGNDFIAIQSLLKEAYQGNATWLINRLIIGEVRKLKDATSGQYIWQPGLTVGQPGTLLGRPVRMANDLASSLAIDNNIGLYGDFRQGYQIVDRIGIRVLRDPYSAKPYVEFYTTKRVGGGVKNFEAIKVLQCKAS